jgi:hypothetical protein
MPRPLSGRHFGEQGMRKRQRSDIADGFGFACPQIVSGGEGRSDRPLSIAGARRSSDC